MWYIHPDLGLSVLFCIISAITMLWGSISFGCGAASFSIGCWSWCHGGRLEVNVVAINDDLVLVSWVWALAGLQLIAWQCVFISQQLDFLLPVTYGSMFGRPAIQSCVFVQVSVSLLCWFTFSVHFLQPYMYIFLSPLEPTNIWAVTHWKPFFKWQQAPFSELSMLRALLTTNSAGELV